MPPMLPEADPNKDPLSKLYSAWLVTVNTNSARNEVIRPFRLAWEYIVAHLSEFMTGRDGGQLLEVRENHAFERGGIYHKIHLHSKLVAKTTGLAFLDPKAIKEYINRKIKEVVPTYKGGYVNLRLIRNYNAAKYVQDYLEKDIVSAVLDEEV